MIIELRSDTFTKPSAAMLEVMFAAQVGDDVFNEDPTVNELQQYCATLFGMEDALFCPSGTMTNQLAIKCHTQPGDEVICDTLSHVYQYEGGGIAFNSGCSVNLINGTNGQITAAQVQAAINNRSDIHKAYSSLVSLENTCNRAGGTCYNFTEIEKIKEVCVANNLKLHLDGARIFNAIVAKNETALQYGKVFDSISVCLSKGLGAPIGSVLLGNKNFIAKAKRFRKVFGGGMRQAGYLAAAGLYALQHNITALQHDHQHAKLVAEALQHKDFVKQILPVETNIVIFEVQGRYTAKELEHLLAAQNVFCIAMSATQIRFVFHLDVTSQMVEQLLDVINAL
jgi:threonine aldolase